MFVRVKDCSPKGCVYHNRRYKDSKEKDECLLLKKDIPVFRGNFPEMCPLKYDDVKQKSVKDPTPKTFVG